MLPRVQMLGNHVVWTTQSHDTCFVATIPTIAKPFADCDFWIVMSYTFDERSKNISFTMEGRGIDTVGGFTCAYRRRIGVMVFISLEDGEPFVTVNKHNESCLASCTPFTHA